MALRPINSISLCAGAGGLDLAVELALPGTRTVAYVEREAYAAATLVARMEEGSLAPALVWSDLATFDARPFRGRVHLVTSGDPCQPNSSAGKRLGAADDRFLADQVLRVVDECRPLRLVRENVTGNADGQLEALVPSLEAMGYSVAAGIFSVRSVGGAHIRERLVIMADAKRWRRSGSEPRMGSGEGAARRQGCEQADGAAGLRASFLPILCPGPDDPRWPDIVATAPHLEPAVRRMADGLAHRVDRLRLCGNGAHPLALGHAIVALDALHAEAGRAGQAAVRAA